MSRNKDSLPQKKPVISEIIVVEGRDDTNSIKRAVEAATIETHGFGIRPETWKLIEKAVATRGIIIFTDPDHAGEEIRRRVLKRFPGSKEAFLHREEARQGSDIGVENAAPEAIIRALQKARVRQPQGPEEKKHAYSEEVQVSGYATKQEPFTLGDLGAYGLVGGPGAKEGRAAIGARLGIGYGNSTTFVRKLNEYGITREEFHDAVIQEKNNGNQ